MSRAEDLPSAVASVIIGGAFPDPCGADALDAAERRLRVRLPKDLREFYLRMNGSGDMTDVNRGLVYLWPVQQWERVQDERRPHTEPPLQDAVVFADHSASCFEYAARFSPEFPDEMRIHLLGECIPACIATTFTEFIELILSNARSLYGETE